MPKASSKSNAVVPFVLLFLLFGVLISILVIIVTNISKSKEEPFDKIPMSSIRKKSRNPAFTRLMNKPNDIRKKPIVLRKTPKPNLNLSDSALRDFMIDSAKRKLNLVRPAWINREPIIQHKDEANWLEIDADWTDNAGWMSQIRNRVVICGNTRTTMKVTSLGPDFTGKINNPQATVNIPSGHTRFGQGCDFTWSEGGQNKMIYIVPMTKTNGGVSLGLYLIQDTLIPIGSPLSLTDASNFHAGWVTQDPISKNIFVKHNSRGTVSDEAKYITIYNLQATPGMNFNIEYLLDSEVRNPIRNCTGGFFSRNGIMYMANNRDENSGFTAFYFNYDEYLERYIFEPKRSYRVRKPSESIFGGDSQDIVGFTSLYGMFPLTPNLFGMLHKNQDVGNDNLSWTSIDGLM